MTGRQAATDGGERVRSDDACDGRSRRGPSCEGCPSEADTVSPTGDGSEMGPSGPSVGHSPEGVVRAQIRALTDADGSRTDRGVDAGIKTLFDFAAPEFRLRYGSLVDFAEALSTPIHRPLLAATSIERGPLRSGDRRATQTVLANHPNGDRTYEFVLTEQRGGKYEGCWMTTAIDLVYDGVSPSFRRMPTVKFGDAELKCDDGATLRSVLLRATGYSPHNDVSQVANCGGNGLCGTCAVEVTGETSEMGAKERTRLDLPPHDGEDGLRLACQTRVHGDLVVRKHGGVWGQHVRDRVESDDEPAEILAVTDAEYEGTYDYERIDENGTDEDEPSDAEAHFDDEFEAAETDGTEVNR